MLTAVLLVVAFQTSSQVRAVTVSPCQENTVEILEKSPHTTVTCRGLSAQQAANWRVTFPYLPEGLSVGSCPSVGTCTSSPALGYAASRPSADWSSLTIDPTVNVNWVQNGTIFCLAVENSILRGSDDCRLDVVYPPDSISCSVQPDTSHTPWTVRGQCDVTKVYSHLSRYRCRWYRKEGTSQETGAGQVTMTTTPAEGKYVNGSCTVDMAWPFVDTTYRVVLTPGGNSQNVQTAGISKPSARLANCPADVIEGQQLHCTCAGDPGEPAGELKWSHLDSSQPTLPPLNRSHNGHKYQCLAVWKGRTVQTVDYTVNIMYGPDTVSITPPGPLTLDTDGSLPLTLTCSASVSNPAPSFTWTRLPSTELSTEQSYTFTPKPPADDGASFRCRAKNSRSGREPTDAVSIALNYPPTSGPAITSNSSDGNLYENDTVVITCTATGGKPVGATSVTLTCQGAGTSQRHVNSTSVSSSVTYVSLSASHHGKQCTCSTGWKNTNWYRHNETMTVSVISPPSVPVISLPSRDYPPIAGVTRNVILTCVSADTGRSATSYSWPKSLGGSPRQDGQGRGTLTFSTMTAEKTGQEVTCKASNLFTANRHEVLYGRLTLQVYYHPNITLRPVPGSNKCQPRQGTKPLTCEVTQGQPVHFRCKADSNPGPADFSWHKDGGTVTQSAAGTSTLDIQASNHTLHNGRYSCTVRTASLNDSRQPLESTQQLAVLVLYPPDRVQLTVNGQRNVTVMEQEAAVLTCHANGRPAPRMDLVNADNGTSVTDPLPQGNAVLEDVVTWHNHTLSRVMCQDAGHYTCTAGSSTGPSDGVTLYVYCKPRPDREAGTAPAEPPTVNYVGPPVQETFNLVAHPVPANVTFFYLGSSPGNRSEAERPVTQNILQTDCWPTHLLYKVTCNVTVDNLTADDEGLYAARVANQFGHADLEFMVTFNESVRDKQVSGPPSNAAALGGGIASAIVVIGLVAVVLFLVRRRRKASENAGERHMVEAKCDRQKLTKSTNAAQEEGHSGFSDLSCEKSASKETPKAGDNVPGKPTAVVKGKQKHSHKHRRQPGAVYENVELNTQRRGWTSSSGPSPASSGPSPAARKSSHHNQPTAATPSHAAQTDTPSEDAIEDYQEIEEIEIGDDAHSADRALYADVEYMTSQEATLGLDRVQQYLLDKLRGEHVNEEFQKLPTGHQKDCEIGSKEENRAKNRFRSSILPYDENRVVLQSASGSSGDYINASHIRGFSSGKSYIAAQGPKRNTVIDFWNMVWQEKTTHIAMLTNLTEGEKNKCEEYWPHKEKPMKYGAVSVTCIDVSRRADYVVRTFEIKRTGGGPCRHVLQYHFVTWLDHSIPTATALVDFWRTVSSSHREQTSPSPLLVHCSAGVGRTGTLIALDMAMDILQEKGDIDVLSIVQRLREDRVNMVQTLSQYRFLHEAILEAYTSREARLALLSFNSLFPDDIGPQTHNHHIDREFKLLNQMKVLLHKPSHSQAKSDDNLKKNRTLHVLPDDNHLVYLTTYVRGRNQYINAVFLPSFYSRRGCILTQLPLQRTLVDIWRLVDGNDVTTIVSLGQEVDGGESKCCYWPRKDGESMKFGPFTVTLQSRKSLGPDIMSYTIAFQPVNAKVPREVNILQYKTWETEVPESSQDLLVLVDLVNKWSSREDEEDEDKDPSPIVVQCLDGASKSGLFRAICDVINRMTSDHDVDVYMAVRHVQTVRPESVKTAAQYRYIYHVIQEYQKKNAVYSN